MIRGARAADSKADFAIAQLCYGGPVGFCPENTCNGLKMRDFNRYWVVHP